MNRTEAAAEAMRPVATALEAKILAEAALAASDAVLLSDATVERAERALYEHREGGLTCYDHHPSPGFRVWCCPCGEHKIRTSWREHVARAVLAAALKEAGE